MNIAKIQTNNNIFASFAEKTLSNDNKGENQPLSNEIESWAREKQNPAFDVFVATLLCQNAKPQNTAIYNLLLYNLNSKEDINKFMKGKKIVFQCLDYVDNLENRWRWLEEDYLYYYFYGHFSIREYNKYVLYSCNCNNNDWIKINLEDIEKLKETNGVKERRSIINSYEKNNVPKVRKNTKYCLKLKIPDDLIDSVDKLTNYIVPILVYLNAKNIIEYSNLAQIVRDKGGSYNPSYKLLYYCEIERVSKKKNIEAYVCQIENKICSYNGNLKGYPGFYGSKWEITYL